MGEGEYKVRIKDIPKRSKRRVDKNATR